MLSVSSSSTPSLGVNLRSQDLNIDSPWHIQADLLGGCAFPRDICRTAHPYLVSPFSEH